MSILTLGLRTTRTVFVGNVQEDIGEMALHGFMGSIGEVECVTLMDKDAGVWEVVYENAQDAKDALLVSGTLLKGKAIEVKKHPSTVEQEEQAAAIAAGRVPANSPTPQGALVLHGAAAAPGQMQMHVTSSGQTIAPVAPVGVGVNTTGVPGAGLTKDIVEMVKQRPELANTIIPLLEAHTAQGQTELGLLQMVTNFHKERAQREAEVKDLEEKMKLQQEIERLKREKLALEAREKDRSTPPPGGDDRSASPNKRRRRSPSSDSGRRRRRRRSSSEDRRDRRDRDRRDERTSRRGRRGSSRSSSSGASPRQRSQKAQTARGTPAPSKSPAKGAGPAVYDVDTAYVSSTPTTHLYIVYAKGTSVPPLEAVRKHFDALGKLDKLKVSKSLGCVFASLDKLPDNVLATLAEKAEFKDAKLNFAATAYPAYMKEKADAEKKAAREKEEKEREAREKKRREERAKEKEREREEEKRREKEREREREEEERRKAEKAEKKKSKWEGRSATKEEKSKSPEPKEAEKEKEKEKEKDRRRRDDSDDRDHRRRRGDSRDYDRRRRGDSRDRDYDRRDRRDRDRRDYDRRDRRRDSRDRYRRR